MILDELASYSRKRVETEKQHISQKDIETRAYKLEPMHHLFLRTLSFPELSFICELKKASPSKGIISEKFPYRTILHDYQRAGADAISCLTEPKWFLGSNEIFEDVRANTKLALLKKDFIVDSYQIYESRLLGADAILLICALLDQDTLTHYLEICNELGLDALVEAHNENEIEKALKAGAHIIGVNNRNLKDFSVDFDTAQRMRAFVPSDCLYVVESGVKSPEDVASVAAIDADAVLMGEVVMKCSNVSQFLEECRQAADEVYC